MKKKKGEKHEGQHFSDFVEKAVTPDDGIYMRKAIPEQNAMEARMTFVQDYGPGRYDRLTKGLWILIAVVIIFLVSSVLLIMYSSYGNLNVIHAEKDTVALYELRITNSGRAWIKDVKFLGPYSIRCEYRGMEGKAALLARFSVQYNIDMIICSEREILELADNGFIVTPKSVMEDSSVYSEYKAAFSEDSYYGFKAGDGLEVAGTGQIKELGPDSIIAVTRSGSPGRSRRSISRFFEIYYGY